MLWKFAVYRNLDVSKKKVSVLNHIGSKERNYFLATIHRQENVDNEERFRGILKDLGMVKKRFGLEVVCPVHPRTKKQMETFGIKISLRTMLCLF